MVTIKSKKEIEAMRQACKVVALTYKELERKIQEYLGNFKLERIE